MPLLIPRPARGAILLLFLFRGFTTLAAGPPLARRRYLQVSFTTEHAAEKLVGRVVGVWVPAVSSPAPRA